MACEPAYVRSLRRAVNAASRKWELRLLGDGSACNKLWVTHCEGAEVIARTTLGADPTDVPTLIRASFRTMAAKVRQRMVKKSVSCTTLREAVAARTRKEEVVGGDVVKWCARQAAAGLLEEAGDAWVQERWAMNSGVSIGGQAMWDEISANAQKDAREKIAGRAKLEEVMSLFVKFYAKFMAAARATRARLQLSPGEARARVARRRLRFKSIPTDDPVAAAAHTAAALLLAAHSDGGASSSGGDNTAMTTMMSSQSSSAVRSETRPSFAPAVAAATAATAATGAAVDSKSGKEQSPTPAASANPTPAGTTTMMAMLPPASVCRSELVRRRSAPPLGPANASHHGLPRRTVAVAAPEYGTSGIVGKKKCKAFAALGATPGRAAAAEEEEEEEEEEEAMGAAFGAAVTADPVGAGAGVMGDWATDEVGGESLESLLLEDWDLEPAETEMPPWVGPIAVEETAAAATAAMADLAAWTFSPAVAGEDAGAGATAVAAPTPPAATLNKSEVVLDAVMPPTSPGRETTGSMSDPDFDMDDVNGPFDGGGGSGSGSGRGKKKRKADGRCSSSEGGNENPPCDGGPRKKVRSGG